MHRRLYKGLLKEYYPHFLSNKPFAPHMTIGRISDEGELKRVVEKYSTSQETFEDVVRKISVEIIDEDENSIIEMTIGME
jgi:2'-5' RNA ligase